MSVLDYDVTTKAERESRRERAQRRTAGPLSAVDYLTEPERQLLETIRALGYDIQRKWIDHDGELRQHGKTVVKAAPSWSHSIDAAARNQRLEKA